MKRALLAILILATGTTVFCALRNATIVTRNELTNQTNAWHAQTQQLARLHIEKQLTLERLNETKELLAAQPPVPALTQLAAKVLSGESLTNLSPRECEQLRAELDCSWNTTGDYLVISKKSLEGISFDSVKDAKLTGAARAALAMTDQEQATLGELMQRLAKSHSAWAKEHIQREEPTGDIVAKYSLPVNEEFTQSLSNQFTTAIYATLGDERGQLFQQHAYSWMSALGMGSGPASAYANSPATITIERYSKDSDQLRYTLQRANSQMQTSVSPWQPFPEEFRTAFPGGWQELAQREGFELPKEFKKK